jgi:hypothetical protein
MNNKEEVLKKKRARVNKSITQDPKDKMQKKNKKKQRTDKVIIPNRVFNN